MASGKPERTMSFYKFLDRFKTERASEFTHTSISPGGRYYVSASDEPDFYEGYTAAMREGCELTLTERHKDIAPVLIDLDFRAPLEQTEHEAGWHVYPPDVVTDVVSAYMEVASEYLPTHGAQVFVMEKSSARVDASKGYIKDGIHIVIPSLVTRPVVQYFLRDKALERFDAIFKDMGLQNTVEDIFDRCVIATNNWQMLGSTKPNVEPYRVTRVFNYIDGALEACDDAYNLDDQASMVELLSIRNKYHETHVLEPKKQEMDDYERVMDEEEFKKRVERNVTQGSKNTSKNTVADLEYVQKIVGCLSADRANRYDEWIRLGWCLRNIDHRLVDTWDEFSKKSNKYDPGKCHSMWEYMRTCGLGMGSLCMWAKNDDPEQYKQIVSEDISSLMNKIANDDKPTDHDIANIIKRMYSHMFCCASMGKEKKWYEFRDHRWVSCEDGWSLRNLMSTEVARELYQYAQKMQNVAALSDDSMQQNMLTERVKRINAVAKSLKSVGKKKTILTECADIMYKEKFEEKLDSNTHLLCFNNGVYDLEMQEFREGRPEDYISFTTGVNYEPFDPQSQAALGIDDFIKKVLPNADVRDYVLGTLASALDGTTRDERFNVWTGVGSNGKSKLIELFEHALGEYTCKFNVSLLTQKRIGSNQTNSEVVRAKGKRFAVLQEPGDDERLNVGIMKEITGGDKIIARGLFKEPIEFKPQFKMVLTCNHLPEVPADDGGTWRRIRVVEFTSRFCHDPVKENEFLIDTELSLRFDEWKESFIAMLIERHKEYKTKGLPEPDEVMKCTREYQKSNDAIAEFIDEQLVEQPGETVTVAAFLKDFGTWVADKTDKKYKKKEIEVYLDRKVCKLVSVRGSGKALPGYILRKDYEYNNSILLEEEN